MVRYRFGHVGVDDISTCEFPFNGDAADLDRASQCMTLPADERQNDVVKTQEHCVREIDVAFLDTLSSRSRYSLAFLVVRRLSALNGRRYAVLSFCGRDEFQREGSHQRQDVHDQAHLRSILPNATLDRSSPAPLPFGYRKIIYQA
jgi:hypothetical protein